MNLLECYIKEVHSIRDVTDEWNKKVIEDGDSDLVIHEFEPVMLEIEYTYDCYGGKTRTKSWYRANEWEEILKKGYYMG